MSSVAAIAAYLAELEKARQQAWREYDRNGRTRYHEGVATGLERAALLTRKHISLDDGTEYAARAERVAIKANAELVEPIRLALLSVSEERNEHWRRYLSGLGPQGPAQHGNAVPECPQGGAQ